MKRAAKKQVIIHGSKLKEVLREEVQNALAKQEVKSSENAEFYLVNLLHNFQRTENLFEHSGPGLIEKPLSIMLMEAMHEDLDMRVRCLKRVGDFSLIITGFFAENIHSGLVDIPHYISIGGTAYSYLSDSFASHSLFSALYNEMSEKFADFTKVLAAVAPWHYAFSNIDLVRIYERWLTTGDEKLKDVLHKQGISTDAKQKEIQ